MQQIPEGRASGACRTMRNSASPREELKRSPYAKLAQYLGRLRNNERCGPHE
jgi:hypothetical protein